MNDMDYITRARLIDAMTEYDRGDTLRIQHFLKVHDLAMTIGTLEGMPQDELDILEAAAIMHDIGIHPAEKKYGNCAGPHQEELGPAEAVKLVASVNDLLPVESRIGRDALDRICFLIGHHHTYTGVDSLDWQILLEADFLVNLYEDKEPVEAVMKVKETIFRTKSGTRILDNMFGL